MKKIQMVDLQTQYEHLQPEMDKAVLDVMASAQFVKGKKVTEFQEHLEEYLGVKHVIPCANGTEAIQIALMALGLKPGDEVITPTFTFIATAEVVALLGLTPVVVDVDVDTMCISADAIRRAITPKTKAIVPVHLFGQNANMEEILAIAKEHNLYVVEDTAQAIGARYTFSDGTIGCAGCMGTIGTTSFFPSKNLGCYGDGGALMTNDDALAQRIRVISNHGMEVRYHHDLVGVNSRLDTIQAAILDVKLPHLDEYIASRKRAAAYYDKALADIAGLITPKTASFTEHTYHQYTLRVLDGKRDALREFLAEHNIPAMIYYPIPLHRQKAYLDPRYTDSDFPAAETLAAEVLSLPMHTELDDEQLAYITAKIHEFFA